MATLGSRIRDRRLELGMTQRQLAYATNIGISHICKIETDTQNPIEEKLRRIAGELDLDLDELVFAAGRVPADVLELLAQDPEEAAKWAKVLRHRARLAAMAAERTATRTTRP